VFLSRFENRIMTARLIGSLLLVLVGANAFGCSTFALHDGRKTVVAHHLDTEGHVPGLVVINKRSTHRAGVGWKELITGAQGSKFEWVSRWGSVTLNTWGIGYPDGGINERGLYIQEMSLAGSMSPIRAGKPALFAPVWMQYVLDHFETVDQVIDSASQFTVDGMEWHFMVVERGGRRAVIEFIDGEVVVHTGEAMPVPLVCNGPYRDELARWRGVLRKRDTGQSVAAELDRFARGAQELDETARAGATVERALTVLAALEQPITQWTYLFELGEQRLRYRTRAKPDWRVLTFAELDFSSGRTLAWDIDEADVTRWLQPATTQLHALYAHRAVEMFQRVVGAETLENYLQSLGGSVDELRRQLADASRWKDSVPKRSTQQVRNHDSGRRRSR
jgi:hypothetical protein